MKISAIEIKPGNVLEKDGKLWLVLKRDLIQPGKGGAFAQVEMRDIKTGTKSNDRYRTQETVERVRLDEKDMQFLFMDGKDVYKRQHWRCVRIDRSMIRIGKASMVATRFDPNSSK